MITFPKIKKWFREDLNRQGEYKGIKNKVLSLALNEVLEGYRDLIEAKEDLKTMRQNKSIYYTARGYEVNYRVLEKAIEEAEKTGFLK